MKNYKDEVLKVCIGRARSGDCTADVFDLMYDTGLSYCELKGVLDALVAQNELEVIDIRTYKFTGDIDCGFEDAEAEEILFEAPPGYSRPYLEKPGRAGADRFRAETGKFYDGEIDEEELRYRALKTCIESGTASASKFQRTFHIGYIRACNLLNWMENMGYVTSFEGFKPRKVLITAGEFNKIYGEPHCAEAISFDGADEDDEDLDNKFAEYEEYLQKQLAAFDDSEEGGGGGKNADCRRDIIEIPDAHEFNNKCALVAFLKTILWEGKATKPWEEVPEHPSWNNEDVFMQVCGERLTAIVDSDKKAGRKSALKKATALLEEARKTGNNAIAEVYECIVFELQNMSNYYYVKIREGLL